MADNYLEKQLEKYAERKAAWEKTKKHGKKKPTSTEHKNDQASQSKK